jgi:hypothetical protein
MELIWEQEAAGSNPAIPTGSSYFQNLEPIALKASQELFVPGWTSADVAKRCPLLMHVDSHLFGHRAWVLFNAARLAKQLLWAADVLALVLLAGLPAGDRVATSAERFRSRTRTAGPARRAAARAAPWLDDGPGGYDNLVQCAPV